MEKSTDEPQKAAHLFHNFIQLLLSQEQDLAGLT